MQALAIQSLGGGKCANIAYPDDTALQNGKIAGCHPIMIYQGSPC
jgi:hypothetical protein